LVLVLVPIAYARRPAHENPTSPAPTGGTWQVTPQAQATPQGDNDNWQATPQQSGTWQRWY